MKADRRRFITGSAALASAAAALGAPASSSAQNSGGPALVGPATVGLHPPPGKDPLDARSKTGGTATEALSVYAVGLRYADLDAATVRKAKHRVLDLIGCAIGGAPAEGNAALAATIKAGGGAPQASVIGYPVKAAVADVALTNAVISRSFDFEVMTVVVGEHEVASHHSPTNCMTTLAHCEQQHLSGRDFLTALTVGDDIAARTLAASGLDFGQGWDGSPLYGALGAAAISSRLQGLSSDQTRYALGLTVDQIAGTIQSLWDGGTNWKLQQGTAARAGVFCAQLAKQGWSSMNDALLAPYGFFAQYTSGCAFPELLTENLGKAFYAEEYFKPFPSCAANHPSIECALTLRERHGLKPADIQRIVIKVQPGTLRVFVAKPFVLTPSAHAQANFSLPFSICTALLHGGIRQEHYDQESMRAPDLARLIDAVSLQPMAAGTRGVRVEVTTNDGQVLAQDKPDQASRYPRQSPAGYDEIVAKFHRQVAFSGFIPPADADEIVRRVDALEREADMADFVRLLTRRHLPIGL